MAIMVCFEYMFLRVDIEIKCYVSVCLCSWCELCDIVLVLERLFRELFENVV